MKKIPEDIKASQVDPTEDGANDGHESFYRGFWHFTSDLASKDSAYTSLALGAHTDTTYFSDPAGLQTFHLLSHTDGDGGSSLLVDGFRAAEILRRESPAEYETLCRVKIRGHASGNEKVKFLTDLAHPVLVATAEADEPGKPAVRQVRWNNDDRAAMVARDPDEIARWYSAAKKWVEILRRRESEYWEQLRPGRPLIFDNWRVLHGRSAFTGRREICGGYSLFIETFV
ncbi:MAG: hypothetical protein L6R41_002927 [Letrouitia leprolyta]|nr:MAG: hypothetical protein L6R41_002927 [Letrouitia leprolyta]